MFPSQPLKKLKGEVMLLHHSVVVNEQQPFVSGLIPAFQQSGLQKESFLDVSF